MELSVSYAPKSTSNPLERFQKKTIHDRKAYPHKLCLLGYTFMQMIVTMFQARAVRNVQVQFDKAPNILQTKPRFIHRWQEEMLIVLCGRRALLYTCVTERDNYVKRVDIHTSACRPACSLTPDASYMTCHTILA